MKLTFPKLLASSAALVAIVPAAYADPDDLPNGFHFGSSYGYSSGKYGTPTTTTINTVAGAAGYTADNFSIDLSVPFVQIDGAPSVIPGVGAVVNTNPKKRKNGAAKGSASGLGDIVLSGDLDVYTTAEDDFGVEVGGKVKFGTGKSGQGLGTGQNDYSGEIGLWKDFSGVLVTGDVGYTSLGSTKYIKLQSGVPYGQFSISTKIGAATSIGALYDVEGDHVNNNSATSTNEMTVFIAQTFAEHLRFEPYLLKGFSRGSPNWGAGASINYSF